MILGKSMRLPVLILTAMLATALGNAAQADPTECRSLLGQNLCDIPNPGLPPGTYTGPPRTTFQGPPAKGPGPRRGGTIEAIEKDIEWCINGSANNRLDQQPMRDYCDEALFGEAAGLFVGNQYAALISTRTQKEWSRLAIPLACQKDPQALAAAVGLLALCQCHDASRAERMIKYPNVVLKKLRRYDGGC